MACRAPADDRPSRASRRRSGGFALLVVLWTLVLVAFLVAHLTASGRTEIAIARNLAANAAAQAAADGAMYRAIFRISEPQAGQSWPLDGTVHELRIGNIRIAVRIEDEAARINPNLAPLALLAGLLQASGSDPATARSLAQAIGVWVGSAPLVNAQSSMRLDSRANQGQYQPPGEPVERLRELQHVFGMTPLLYAAIRPHLTLYGPPVPNLVHADPVVMTALRLAGLGTQAPAAGVTGPAALATARIIVTARGPGNAEARRTAIVRIGPPLPRGYAILALDDDAG
jgi:general secretion pathway protein K